MFLSAECDENRGNVAVSQLVETGQTCPAIVGKYRHFLSKFLEVQQSVKIYA
jgi:hypothetical protein